nr:hypothetical transcript [Hymenolepis microstoma]
MRVPLSTTPTPPMTPQTTQPRRQHHQCASHSSASATAFPTASPTPFPPPSPNPPPIALLYPSASTPSISPPQANQLRFQYLTSKVHILLLKFVAPSAILASHGVAFMAPYLSTSTPKKSSSSILHIKPHSAQPSSATHTAPNSPSSHTSPPSQLKRLPRSQSSIHAVHGGLMLTPLVLLQQCHAQDSSLPHLNSHTQYPQSAPLLTPTPQPPPSNTSMAPAGTRTAQFATRSSPDRRFSQLISDSCTTHQPLDSAEKPFVYRRCGDQFTASSDFISLNKHNSAPPSLPPPPLNTPYQSTRLASTNTTTTTTNTTTTNNTPTANNTNSKQQAQASALMSLMLSANTTTSHSFLHFPSIHH